MPLSNHRWKMVAAAIVILLLLLAVNILLVRWVRKSRDTVATRKANIVSTHTNASDSDGPEAPRALRAVFSTISARSFDDKEGAQENVDHLGYWDRHTWVRYNAVDFGAGVSSVVAVLSCGRQFKGRIVYFHLDGHDGSVIAELEVPATRGFEAVAAPVQSATGVHDVFLTCNDGGFNLQSIRFIRPQSATNLIAATSYSSFKGIQEPRPGIVGHTDGGDWIEYQQIDFGQGVSSVALEVAMGPKDAKIEFHLDTFDGPLIATLIPSPTGDWSTFQTQESPAQGATGVHDLYLTFHGGRGLADIRALQFKTSR